MPTFPRTEAEIVALAEQMIAGYTEHAGDFPSVTVAELQAELTNYKEGKQTQEDAKGQLHIATSAKEEDLEDLIEMMKNDLKKSEVDAAAAPDNLYEIGWGPRQQPQPEPLPGMPDYLHPTAEGPGDLWLKWTSPAAGGIVRNYIIERREQTAGGTFGSWAVVGTSINNEIHLLEQPRGIQMEYRVKAANASGEGMPSNVAEVVL